MRSLSIVDIIDTVPNNKGDGGINMGLNFI